MPLSTLADPVHSTPGDIDATALFAPASAPERSTGDAEDLPSLIGAIYDAAIDPDLWPAVLARCARYVGGTGAALFCKTLGLPSGRLFYEDGSLPESYRRRYFETYLALDPTTAGQLGCSIGDIVGTDDLIPYAEFERSRFFRELARPAGLVDCVIAVLDKDSQGALLFCVHRLARHGLVDAAARRRMAELTPHVRRAALICELMDQRSIQREMLADALDGLGAATFLVTPTGRIVHENASARTMLAEARIVRAPRGVLRPVDATAAARLGQAVATTAGGDCRIGAGGLAVPLGPAGERGRYVAHVLPLGSGARARARGRHAASAAVFVHQGVMPDRTAADLLAELYGLTPSEIRVLISIARLDGVAATAAALGIGEATVRTHLHRIFEKTGTRSQAGLVRLLAGAANPLLS